MSPFISYKENEVFGTWSVGQSFKTFQGLVFFNLHQKLNVGLA